MSLQEKYCTHHKQITSQRCNFLSHWSLDNFLYSSECIYKYKCLFFMNIDFIIWSSWLDQLNAPPCLYPWLSGVNVWGWQKNLLFYRTDSPCSHIQIVARLPKHNTQLYEYVTWQQVKYVSATRSFKNAIPSNQPIIEQICHCINF